MAKDERQKCTSCDEDNRDPNCYWCSGTGYETRTQDIIVCPHCGEQLSYDDIHETTDLQCDECGGWLEVEVNYTVDYTTNKTDPPDVKARKRREEYERWDAMMKERHATPSEKGK